MSSIFTNINFIISKKRIVVSLVSQEANWYWNKREACYVLQYIARGTKFQVFFVW